MSQAGGPNSAGSVNIDFTGTTTGVEQAAKKAEATVQQAAQNMKAQVASVASAAGSSGAAAGIGAGPSASIGGVTTQSAVGFSRIGSAAKDALRPIMSLVQAFSQLTLVAGIFVGVGVGIYNWLTSGAREAKAMAEHLKEVGENAEKAFSKFDYQNATPEGQMAKELDDLKETYKEFFKEVEKIRATPKDWLGNNMWETTDEIKERWKKAKALEDKLNNEYYEAQANIYARFETRKEEIRQRAAEEAQRKEDQARKEREAKERDSAKRVQEFWRDVRGNQTSGFAVEGFQTSNLSQSLDLLARQRGGVDGPKQLRVDYGGTR